MHEVGRLRDLSAGGGRVIRPLSSIFLLFLFFLLFSSGCTDSSPEESDAALDYIHTSRSLILDSGTPEERLLRGDTLREFLDDFRRDTFEPGPRSVRIESDCHPGVLMIGRDRFPVAYCSVWEMTRRRVITIDLDTGVVRLINKGEF